MEERILICCGLSENREESGPWYQSGHILINQKITLLKISRFGNPKQCNMQRFLVAIISTCIIVASSSCGNVKNFQYLQGPIDTASIRKVNIVEPTIQKGDILGITVYSDDPLATLAVTNPVTNTNTYSGTIGGTSNAASGSTSGSSSASGFLVNPQGQIQIYKLGLLPTEGKTKKQLADTMALLYSNLGLLKNPFVEVRFLNFKVTVIGEVGHPGLVSVPSEKLNAFEAVGLAGDVTVYGRRDNILVVREINGVREFGRIDLTKPDVFLSPYYNLQQNDLVIVDVGKNKAAANNQSTIQYISLGASLLSIAAIFITIFR
jgi:polysaccharide export outer membrane protein